MSETLIQFVERRRNELQAEAEQLEAALLSVRSEQAQLDQVLAMVGPMDPSRPPGILDKIIAFNASRVVSPKRLSEATIKERVTQILTAYPDGLSALDILSRINRRAEVPYPRTSLSPQLSRLKADGHIHREGRIWLLGGGLDVGRGDEVDEAQEIDELLNGPPDPEPHEAPSDHSDEAS